MFNTDTFPSWNKQFNIPHVVWITFAAFCPVLNTFKKDIDKVDASEDGKQLGRWG
jgi:hypothetical protein